MNGFQDSGDASCSSYCGTLLSRARGEWLEYRGQSAAKKKLCNRVVLEETEWPQLTPTLDSPS
jgi:hypothetical protein